MGSTTQEIPLISVAVPAYNSEASFIRYFAFINVTDVPTM